VLLQKNSSADEIALMSQCELEDVSTELLSRVHQRNMPSVAFLAELVRWIDPSYAAAHAPFSSSSPEQTAPKPHSSGSSLLFNINKLPLSLQVHLNFMRATVFFQQAIV
jgi:hypothetical protein